MDFHADFSSAELDSLPRGTIIRRKIRGKDRFYHQWREGGRTRSRYLRAGEVLPLRQQIERRKEIERQLKGKSRILHPRPSPSAHSQDLLPELTAHAMTLKKRNEVAEIVDFIANEPDARILLIKGLPDSGKTTVLLQALGELTPDLRARLSLATCPLDLASVPGLETVHAAMRTIDTSVLTFRSFQNLFPSSDLDEFLRHGGLPNDLFRDAQTARRYLDGVAGADAWTALEDLTIPFLRQALLPRTVSHAHGRTRETADVQRVLRRLTALQSERTPDETAVRRLRDLGFLSVLSSETLRPELRHDSELTFNHPGLRHAVAQRLATGLLDDVVFASLGAAERKLVRDTMMSAVLERQLEEVVLREISSRPGPDSRQAVPINLPSGRLALVLADRDELVCELFAVRHAEVRADEQLADLTDAHLLDAVEHRYGTLTDRTVLYLGRNARHPLGIAYRNAADFLRER